MQLFGIHRPFAQRTVRYPERENEIGLLQLSKKTIQGVRRQVIALRAKVVVNLVGSQEGCRLTQTLLEKLAHDRRVGDSIALHEVLIKNQVDVFLQDARTQIGGGEHNRG